MAHPQRRNSSVSTCTNSDRTFSDQRTNHATTSDESTIRQSSGSSQRQSPERKGPNGDAHAKGEDQNGSGRINTESNVCTEGVHGHRDTDRRVWTNPVHPGRSRIDAKSVNASTSGIRPKLVQQKLDRCFGMQSNPPAMVPRVDRQVAKPRCVTTTGFPILQFAYTPRLEQQSTVLAPSNAVDSQNSTKNHGSTERCTDVSTVNGRETILVESTVDSHRKLCSHSDRGNRLDTPRRKSTHEGGEDRPVLKDPLQFVSKAVSRRTGSDQIESIEQAYVKGGLTNSINAFKFTLSELDHACTDGIPEPSFNWVPSITRAATKALKNGHENRAQLICQQSKHAIQLSYGTKVDDLVLDLIARAAKNVQSARLAADGSRVTRTMTLDPLRKALLDLQDKNYNVSEAQLRTAATIALRIISHGRCEDTQKLFVEGITFEPQGTNFLTCTKLKVRLFDSKSVKGTNRDAHHRSVDAKAALLWSSEIEIYNTTQDTKNPRPDVFKLLAAYDKKREHRTDDSAPMIRGKQLTRFFTGVSGYTIHVQTATTSAAERRLLVSTGCITEDSPFQSKHIRHTTLSTIAWFAHDRLLEALRKARHAEGTFHSNYQLPINNRTMLLLMDMKSQSLQRSDQVGSQATGIQVLRLEDMVWY